MMNHLNCRCMMLLYLQDLENFTPLCTTFCVEQDFLLMLLDPCIARKDILLLHVLPFCVEQDVLLILLDSCIARKDI